MDQIGKKKARDFLRTDFHRVYTNDHLGDVFRKFDETDLNILPVFDKERFLGEIHEIDLLKTLINPRKIPEREIIQMGFGVDFGYYAKRAKDIMTLHDIIIKHDDLIEDIAYLMLREDVKCIPAFDGEQFLGIVTESDIIDSVVKRGIKKWSS